MEPISGGVQGSQGSALITRVEGVQGVQEEVLTKQAEEEALVRKSADETRYTCDSGAFICTFVLAKQIFVYLLTQLSFFSPANGRSISFGGERAKERRGGEIHLRVRVWIYRELRRGARARSNECKSTCLLVQTFVLTSTTVLVACWYKSTNTDT